MSDSDHYHLYLAIVCAYHLILLVSRWRPSPSLFRPRQRSQRRSSRCAEGQGQRRIPYCNSSRVPRDPKVESSKRNMTTLEIVVDCSLYGFHIGDSPLRAHKQFDFPVTQQSAPSANGFSLKQAAPCRFSIEPGKSWQVSSRSLALSGSCTPAKGLLICRATSYIVPGFYVLLRDPRCLKIP